MDFKKKVLMVNTKHFLSSTEKVFQAWGIQKQYNWGKGQYSKCQTGPRKKPQKTEVYMQLKKPPQGPNAQSWHLMNVQQQSELVFMKKNKKQKQWLRDRLTD